MTRWFGWLLLAGAALAQGTEARPIDAMPWNVTLADALEEAEDRGAPLAVYVYKAGEEGDAPAAIGASEATQTLYGYALYRIDVSKDSEERTAFDRKWGSSCDASRAPVVHLFGPDTVWRGQVEAFSDPKPLLETCQSVLAQLEKPPIESGFYRNARAAWRRASDALAAGNARSAAADLEVVVDIAGNCGRDFRFTTEARKHYDVVMAEGRDKLDALKKALAAKEWLQVWNLGRELAEAYQHTVLGAEIGDVLASIDADAEASDAIAKIAAEEERRGSGLVPK